MKDLTDNSQPSLVYILDHHLPGTKTVFLNSPDILSYSFASGIRHDETTRY
jgi:hypothetical protein